ncbi:hypothetical protein AMJ80_00655 [bacterium SM23_31]|nr:MAG: hypothetical protein AMJ80_00655 [bacterium SM23_31]
MDNKVIHRNENLIINPPPDSLRTFDLVRIFLRSFFIQATFTMKEKLSVGFGFALLPGIKRISRNHEHMQQLLKRHSEYYNSHPFMTSFILGSVLRLEENATNNSPNPYKDIEIIKTHLAGVLGSLGDRLFWKFLKPFASIVALIMIFILSEFYPWNIFISIICFLLVFNVLHLFYRLWGIIHGYRAGTAVIHSKSIQLIEHLNFRLACFALGFIGLLSILELRLVYKEDIFGIIIFIAASATAFLLNYKKNSPGLGIIVGLAVSFVIYSLFHLTGY